MLLSCSIFTRLKEYIAQSSADEDSEDTDSVRAVEVVPSAELERDGDFECVCCRFLARRTDIVLVASSRIFATAPAVPCLVEIGIFAYG